MNNASQLNYKFVKPKENEQPPTGCVDRENRCYYPYNPSDDLVRAVNLAIALKRPLLVEGEPGSGKTQLANALVFQLTQNNLKDEKDDKGKELWWPFYIWNVKSYSRARDGLYTFDAVERLRDAQMVGTNFSQTLTSDQIKTLQEKVQNPISYRHLGPLGRAIDEQGKRAVLLIDEVDKADSDFANDLLLELDQYRFDVPETKEPSKFAKPDEIPIVILTSNREKPLPDAFLRRCLYFYIEFPEREELKKIAEQRFNFARENKEEQKLFAEAFSCFDQVRQAMTAPDSRRPSTSEFIDFLLALRAETAANRAKIFKEIANHPFLGILLKDVEDQKLYRKVLERQGTR